MQKSKSSSKTEKAKAGFGVQDVLFVLQRHKWMILLFALVGVGAAAVVYKKRVPIYQSHAKLLVKYVLERSSVDPYESQKSPGSARVDNVMSTEIEILTSVDLALEVAEEVGVRTLLPEAGPGVELSAAAGAVLSGLEVGVGRSRNVLSLTYGSEDPELAKTVLSKVLTCYNDRHLEIHRPPDAIERVAKDTEELGRNLARTEDALDKLIAGSGIVSLADAIGPITSQREQTQKELMAARAELAGKLTNVENLEKAAGEAEAARDDGGEAAPKATVVAPAPVPQQVLADYQTVLQVLETLRELDVKMQIKYKPGNPLMVRNRERIDIQEAKRKELVRNHSGLQEAVQVMKANPDRTVWNGVGERAMLEGIRAKIDLFEKHLEDLDVLFKERYAVGSQIEKLERQKEIEDKEYRESTAKLKNAEIDHELNPSEMPNIRLIEKPTEPIRTYDEAVNKLILGLAGGGLALGLGLAFLIELLLDRRVKRSTEIQTKLQLPLLLTIPFIRRKERGGFLLRNDANRPLLESKGDTALSEPVNGRAGLPAQRQQNEHFILPYSETIRDRIIFNFEVNNVTHKPKLLAVTGLSEGAGSSTIAAGLAKSFSEISGVKVLLVDLSSCNPEDNPLFGEIPRHSLNGALHLATNDEFREAPQSLYYANAPARRDETGLTTFSPVHLYELMPHLQTSDYDYIIFDMPPLDQTSRTLTMAGMMDKVVMVLDAENTSRDGLMWGYSELVKGRADVSCVFNKTRTATPGWLIGSN